jgi:hypothetical protein
LSFFDDVGVDTKPLKQHFLLSLCIVMKLLILGTGNQIHFIAFLKESGLISGISIFKLVTFPFQVKVF